MPRATGADAIAALAGAVQLHGSADTPPGSTRITVASWATGPGATASRFPQFPAPGAARSSPASRPARITGGELGHRIELGQGGNDDATGWKNVTYRQMMMHMIIVFISPLPCSNEANRGSSEQSVCLVSRYRSRVLRRSKPGKQT